MAVDVSILLVNWNTRDLTLRCLDSLPGAVGDDLSYEVVVIDNGSVDGSAEALERRADIDRVVVNAENRGYAAAVNQAYAVATGDLVLLLNSDVVFRPGCVSTLVRFLRERPDVAGVAPLYLNPDGTPQQHYYRLPTFWTVLGISNALLRHVPPFVRRIRAYRMLDDDFSQPRPVPQPSASCLLLRRSCLPAERVFDEWYPVYFNDVALARDLADNGDQLWMTPEAAVLHEHGASCLLLGGKLKRQHLGGLVRYLAATEPRHRVAAFRALALAQGALNRILRRPEAMSISDAWYAVRGDVGPLPQAPRRA
jgi:GT2 family glycosyltransferase